MAGFRKLVVVLFGVLAVGWLVVGSGSAAAAPKPKRGPAIRVKTPTVVIAGTQGRVQGTVVRARGISQVTLERQRPPHKAWTVIARAGVRHGKFVFRVRTPLMTGALKLRVVAGSAGHPAAKSRVFQLAVTETQVLRPGSVTSAPAPGHSGKLVYHGAVKPRVGGYIALGVGKATPHGLLVKVVHVSGRRGHWIVTVRPATLFEVVPTGQLELNPGSPSVDRGAAKLPHVQLRPHFDLSCSAGAAAQANGSASLSLKPSLDLKWSWDWFPPHPVLDSAKFSITASGSVQASASLQGSGSCSFEQELFKHDFSPFDVQIGPIPVVIVPELLTTLKADADASASISTSVGASLSATGGLKYSGGRVSPIESFTKSFSFQPPTPQAEGSIGARLVPAGRLLVYGLAGPEVDLSGGPQFDVDTTASPPWRLHVPVDLSAQLVVPDTPLHLGPLDIFNHDFTLAQGTAGGGGGGGGGASVSVTNPGDQAGNAGVPVNLQIHASDTDGGGLSYSAAGLPSGLSIDAHSGVISGTPSTLGTSSVTVTAKDATGPSGSAAFNWTISASPTGSCEASSSVFVMTTGSNVVAYVPKGNWESTTTGISLVNVEGSSVAPTFISTPNVVNAAASDPFTGETVATANNTDVYVLNGASVTNTLSSGGSGTIGFSGGEPTNAGIAMDSLHNRAAIALSINGAPGYQILDLNSNTFGSPILSEDPGGEISEDPVIDPFRNLLLSASEDGNFEIADLSNPANPAFYENATPGREELDATAEDCSTGIAIAPAEFSDPSDVYIADLSQASFTPGSPGTWSAPSQVQSLSESSLSAGASAAAVAQGTHTGVIAGEFGGNQITAIKLPDSSGSGTPAITDWVTCGIDSTPDGNAWSEGDDPHTMTAYQSPNGGDAIGLFGNEGANWLARVDLTQMLNPAIMPRDAGGHTCSSGTIPSSAESFISVP